MQKLTEAVMPARYDSIENGATASMNLAKSPALAKNVSTEGRNS
jgi:hypothetical protein